MKPITMRMLVLVMIIITTSNVNGEEFWKSLMNSAVTKVTGSNSSSASSTNTTNSSNKGGSSIDIFGDSNTSTSTISTTNSTNLKWAYKTSEYTLGYPDEWKINGDKKAVGSNICLYHKDYPTSKMKLMIRKMKADSSITIQTFVNEYRNYLKKNLNSVKFSECSQYVLTTDSAMISGAKINMTYLADNEERDSMIIVVPSSGGYLILSYIAEPTLFKEHQIEADMIIRSLNVNNTNSNFDTLNFTNTSSKPQNAKTPNGNVDNALNNFFN